jgi:Tfp pilus assembly protein PilV
MECIMISPRKPRGAGFALIEAMVAGLVMAFGMLALVSMQINLSRNGDVAKSRTEAMRLAQEKMEELRSFTVITPTPPTDPWSTTKAWDNMAANNDTVTTNNTYARTWTLGSGNVTSVDVMKTADVTVHWTDRAGEDQYVKISSVISKTDPTDVGFLGFPLPQNTNLKRPKNRNVNIPIPAVDLGGGNSGYQISPNLAVVFSNDSGLIIKQCTSQTAFTISASTDLSGCTTSTALMLAGYINSSVGWPAGLGINYSAVTSADSANINCKFGDATDQTTGATISGYKYYLCVIPISSATTPPSAWGGTIRLGGLASSNLIVCRYQYIDSNSTANARNVQPYDNVTESMDSQNYMLQNANSCSGSGTTVSMVLHQNCRTGHADATNCPAKSTNNF